MKLTRIVLLCLCVAVLQGREIRVKQTRHLTARLDTQAYFPSYSADGMTIYFTHSGFLGLWALDRAKLSVTELTRDTGAGYEPLALPDGSLIYRHDEFVRGRKYTALYRRLNDNSYVLAEAERFVSPTVYRQDKLIYLADETIRVFDLSSESFETSQTGLTAVLNDRLGLQVLQADQLTALLPRGTGDYIWAQISPQGDRIVFTRVGDGSYVCDLKGAIQTDLGLAHAPRWSPDGNYILYMVDLDDGQQFTASEIWVSTADGSQIWQITNTPDRIELYPRWSPTGDRIVYHTLSGELYETTLEIVE